MIRALVQSAFTTGCLSVASEGLIRQVLEIRAYQSADLDALGTLYDALSAGHIQREARGSFNMMLTFSNPELNP